MQIKEFLGSVVLDKNAYEVGKVSNVSEKELQKIDGIGPKLAEKIKLFVKN